MATIIIRDLADSVELDHAAMLAVLGGTRVSGRQSVFGLADQEERMYRYPELASYYQRIAVQGDQRRRG